MGTGFTIDSPMRVAKYGISSVISIGDDIMIEQMRRYHCAQNGETFEPIEPSEEDFRAKRITAYLNMIDRQVNKQIDELRNQPFEPGSDITRYFEMLPNGALRDQYLLMLNTEDQTIKKRLQDELRPQIEPGGIDVNIMTKLDTAGYKNGVKLPQEYSAAMSGLRGYANSTVRSSIIFSAGINPHLYGYIAKFDDFLPDENGELKKKVVLKVSDYRSALIQGKFLAKRGVWVSEYRIESGLNCGGHAFATDGYLMGPILEEFKENRKKLASQMHSVCNKSWQKAGRATLDQPLELRITVQGGIGTAAEDEFLREYYQADATGWGTPFLLVPEVCNVDDEHLQKLANAGPDDVYLSKTSPLGVPFWSLRNSAAEQRRDQDNADGKPGSTCPKGFLSFDTEFTEKPICWASRAYQKLKLKSLEKQGLPAGQLAAMRESVMSKLCLCRDLAAGAMSRTNTESDATAAVCTGQNIVNFDRVATLEEMVGHIYGRVDLLVKGDRPHMFITELALYVEHLKGEVEKVSQELLNSTANQLREFKANLLNGIEYYAGLVDHFVDDQRGKFREDLGQLKGKLEALMVPEAIEASAAD